MNNYFCKLCEYNTNLVSHYNRHLKTDKHQKRVKNSTQIQQLFSIDSTIIQQKLNPNFVCKYCNKTFKHMQSMYRHIKYSCKKNKD